MKKELRGKLIRVDLKPFGMGGPMGGYSIEFEGIHCNIEEVHCHLCISEYVRIENRCSHNHLRKELMALCPSSILMGELL